MMGATRPKKSDDIFSCFNTMHECDRQTRRLEALMHSVALNNHST